MASLEANHYFSPRSFTTEATAERFWIPCKTFAADGGARPKLRGHSVSSALPCISFRIRAKGAAGTFQRGMFPNLLPPETRFSKALTADFCAHSHRKVAAHSKPG